MKIKYSALDIARALRAAGVDAHDPTPEQVAIIESLPLGPSVVIAGAGSGKTETMSARVLWLVANEFVKPEEILGLTFTRKAAGELASRMRKRLRQLRSVSALPIDAATGESVDITVNVATYHSYAGKVLAEHAIRIGIDTDSEPIGEAAAWQIAHGIVTNFEASSEDFKSSADSIIEKVMDLSAQMGEHGATIADIRNHSLHLLQELQSLSGRSNKDVLKFIDVIKERLAILPMVEAYDRYRVEHGELTFSDQMSYAANLVNLFPDISEIERAKYKIILLDEYQDTSYSQVRFLSALFGNGHPVTAVGDPNQAIYGWRSASSETLETFGQHFVGKSGKECKRFTLLTTWRNDENILELANRAIDEISLLAAETASASRSTHVDRLSLRPNAPQGELIALHAETMQAEADAIADRFAQLWNQSERLALPPEQRSTFAVLVRSRKYIPLIEQSLRARSLPVDVVGLGGLIHVPEIADLIALLRVLIFPDSGPSLIRLLAGPKFALGTADLRALGQFTNKLFFSTKRSTLLGDLLVAGDSAILEADDFAIGSVIETLEFFHHVNLDFLANPDYSPTFIHNEQKFRIPREKFTEAGFFRLVQFAHDIRALRRSIAGSITDALIEAERYLYLDTEVLVRDGYESGRKYLDNFLDEAAKFQRSGGSLSAFLEWLKIAESEESGLKPISVDVSHTAIQILTVHASKGSEWNVVAVPGLVKNNFPVRRKRSDLWTDNSGSLPIALRGDRHQLRDFSVPGGGDPHSAPIFSETKKALDRQSEYWESRRIEEEYRLAYVAFTRAKQVLITSATWFGNGDGALDPSRFFEWAHEISAAQQARAAQSHSVTDFLLDLTQPDYKNPANSAPPTKNWPVISPRAELIRRSAQRVLNSHPIKFPVDSENSSPHLTEHELELLEDAQALITELALRREGISVTFPQRISVSSLISLEESSDNFALNLRRPLPRHIDISARRGTDFHNWVEERYRSPKLIDEELSDSEDYFFDQPLSDLQNKWLSSSWAERTPIDIEVGFETMLGGRGGTLIRGRIDAIYPRVNSQGEADGGYEVVDWKTGREKSGADLEIAAIQLAMYRLAYAKLKNVPIEKISAAFHYIDSNTTIRPADLLTEEQLIQIIQRSTTTGK